VTRKETPMGRVLNPSHAKIRKNTTGRVFTLLIELETKEATTTRVLNPHRCSEMKEM
jgi:hypothetical protein